MCDQYPKASITASLNFTLKDSKYLLFLTSGWPLFVRITNAIFLSLSPQALIPVDPSCPKQFDILWLGQAVSNPYDLVFWYSRPVTTVVNCCTKAAEIDLIYSGSFPSFNRILMNLIRSVAVVKYPECPATPLKKYASRSWAWPLTIAFLISKLKCIYINRIRWGQFYIYQTYLD